MTDDDSPIDPLFELQRNTIRQTEETLDNVFTLSSTFGDAFAQGIEPGREVQQQTIELSRQSIHTSLDAVESVGRNVDQIDDLRDSVDDAFDTLADQSEALSYAVEDSYDSLGEDAVADLEDQFELLLELNRTIEERLVGTIERFAEQAGETEEFADTFEQQVELLSDQLEAQADRLEELESRLEDVDFDGDDE